MSAVLSVRDLSKAYGGVQAVSNVSFSVAAGELLALIGPNGAGKTTCFNMVNGQVAADAGDVEFEGRSLAGLKPRDIWRLGVGRELAVDHVEAGRFPGAVGTDQGEQFAGRHLEGDVLDGENAAVPLGQPAHLEGRHRANLARRNPARPCGKASTRNRITPPSIARQ